MTTPANPTPEPDGKVPKRGDDVLIEGMSKELRSLRKKNMKLKAENEHLKTVLDAADGLACAVGAAPHDKSCYWWPKHPRGEPGACTCWKHKALADYSALISEGAGKP